MLGCQQWNGEPEAGRGSRCNLRLTMHCKAIRPGTVIRLHSVVAIMNASPGCTEWCVLIIPCDSAAATEAIAASFPSRYLLRSSCVACARLRLSCVMFAQRRRRVCIHNWRHRRRRRSVYLNVDPRTDRRNGAIGSVVQLTRRLCDLMWTPIHAPRDGILTTAQRIGGICPIFSAANICNEKIFNSKSIRAYPVPVG